MENNWFELFSICMLFFFAALIAFGLGLYLRQYNIYRNERSMHKRLDIRYKREMEAGLKIVEIAVKPIVLKTVLDVNNDFLKKFNSDPEFQRIYKPSLFKEYFLDEVVRNCEFEIIDPENLNDLPFSRISMRLAIIPKEHVKLFDKS